MQIIDLSHKLYPGKEGRQLDAKQVNAPEITGAPPEPNHYIMHKVALDNHLGTHIETPYHCIAEGDNLGTIPAERLIGRGILLDLRGYQEQQAIPLERVQAAAKASGGIKEGDIVLCMTGWEKHYGTAQYFKPPYLSQSALKWIVEHKIKILGVDTTGAMNPERPDRENHLPLLGAGSMYIENLTNLESLPQSNMTIIALPPAIEGVDAIPVRVVAIVNNE